MVTTINVRHQFGKPLLKEKLSNAKKLDDFIPHYPHNWIDYYIGTEIKLSRSGNTTLAAGQENDLSAKQITLLHNIEIGDELTIQIRYVSKNSVTGLDVKDNIELKYSIVADEEAKPLSGLEVVRKYFQQNTFKGFSDGEGTAFSGAAVNFMINENGQITSASLSKSSGNMEADNRLLKSVLNMPAWKPAIDKSGKKYAQKFVLEIVKAGC